MTKLIGGFSENQYNVYLDASSNDKTPSTHWVSNFAISPSFVERSINRCVYCLLHNFSFPNNALLLKNFQRHVFKEKMAEQEKQAALRILRQFQKCKDLDPQLLQKIEQKLMEEEEVQRDQAVPEPIKDPVLSIDEDTEPLLEAPQENEFEKNSVVQETQVVTLPADLSNVLPIDKPLEKIDLSTDSGEPQSVAMDNNSDLQPLLAPLIQKDIEEKKAAEDSHEQQDIIKDDNGQQEEEEEDIPTRLITAATEEAKVLNDDAFPVIRTRNKVKFRGNSDDVLSEDILRDLFAIEREEEKKPVQAPLPDPVAKSHVETVIPDVKSEDAELSADELDKPITTDDPGVVPSIKDTVIDYTVAGINKTGRAGAYTGVVVAGNFSLTLGLGGLYAAATATATAGLAVASGLAAVGAAGTLVAAGTAKSLFEGKPVTEAMVDGIKTPYTVAKKAYSMVSGGQQQTPDKAVPAETKK